LARLKYGAPPGRAEVRTNTNSHRQMAISDRTRRCPSRS
jgi:hypothetical protein